MKFNFFVQPLKRLRIAICVGSLCFVAGCGGGGASGAEPKGSVECSTDAQKDWLRSYMLDWYLWSGQSPNPEPAKYSNIQDYLPDLLYQGSGLVPADRWSYISDTLSFDQFFTEGKVLGYGLFVNGLEQTLPLKVRYVEAQSPASLRGLVRGDQIESVNGRLSADLIATGDFSALNPTKAGDTVALQIRNGSSVRSVELTATTYSLTPVSAVSILDAANGSKVGYLFLKDFISQAETPMDSAFEDFRLANVKDVILDMRYNGGGRVSTANILASLLAGILNDGKKFTDLRYNASHSSQNTSYFLSSNASGFERVVVITGPRTCSVSELVVNGLKPYVKVATVGAQTCGKPFGFLPVASCGSTVNAVNFEAFNAVGEGRYYAGIAADCAASDNFSGALGDPDEVLIATGLQYLQTGSCSTGVVRSRQSTGVLHPGKLVQEPGERRGMWAD